VGGERLLVSNKNIDFNRDVGTVVSRQRPLPELGPCHFHLTADPEFTISKLDNGNTPMFPQRRTRQVKSICDYLMYGKIDTPHSLDTCIVRTEEFTTKPFLTSEMGSSWTRLQAQSQILASTCFPFVISSLESGVFFHPELFGGSCG
jgi:hypothetical protein